MTALRPPTANSSAVDAFMRALEHPFKAEVQALREIIVASHPGVSEEVKWNAPTFGWRDHYLATFNLHARDRVHMVFHNPNVARIASPLLLGDYVDRRMAYFSGMADVLRDRKELERVVRELIAVDL